MFLRLIVLTVFLTQISFCAQFTGDSADLDRDKGPGNAPVMSVPEGRNDGGPVPEEQLIEIDSLNAETQKYSNWHRSIMELENEITQQSRQPGFTLAVDEVYKLRSMKKANIVGISIDDGIENVNEKFKDLNRRVDESLRKAADHNRYIQRFSKLLPNNIKSRLLL